jgi:hypothetical protein
LELKKLLQRSNLAASLILTMEMGNERNEFDGDAGGN